MPLVVGFFEAMNGYKSWSGLGQYTVEVAMASRGPWLWIVGAITIIMIVDTMSIVRGM